ncbi:hypothetical protein F7U66_00915 [Vibrio parahaemolyticus]|nr:hypothetical protein [Vibrio parahaemolyticus]
MFLEKFDKKQIKQGSALAILVLLGVYFMTTLSSAPDDPRYSQPSAQSVQKGNEPKPRTAERKESLFDIAPNVTVVSESVDVIVEAEPPKPFDVKFSSGSIDTEKVMELYTDVRLNTVKLASKKLQKQLDELDAVEEAEQQLDVSPFPFPEKLVPIPQPVMEPVKEDVIEDELVVEDDFEPEPFFDPAVVFKDVSVSSMMVRDSNVTAWLKVAGRSVRVYEGAYIGEFLIKEIHPEYVRLLHIPSDLERYITPPGVGAVKVPALDNSESGGLVGQYVEPKVEEERINYPTDASGNAFAIDMPSGFVR